MNSITIQRGAGLQKMDEMALLPDAVERLSETRSLFLKKEAPELHLSDEALGPSICLYGKSDYFMKKQDWGNTA